MNPTTDDELTPGGLATLRVLGRAIRYVAPFRWQFGVKLGLMVVSYLPLLILPWPLKILIDHVIEEIPIAESLASYPGYLRPVVGLLDGKTSTEILLWIVAFQIVLFVLAGAFGATAGERDRADAGLAQGHDTATRTENEANEGWSFAGGLIGLFDYRWTLRLSQALNHHYRAALFDRVQALPMTAFDDERIGDALYRVMYDTPSITNSIYRILLIPLGVPIGVALIAAVVGSAFADHPYLFWSAASLAPILLVGTLPFAGALRRTSGRSRSAGAATTSTAEEGIANILAVQSLGAESRQRERFDRASWGAFSRYRSVFATRIAGYFVAGVPVIGVLLYVLFRVSDEVVAGVLSRGDFVLLFTYFIRLAILSLTVGGLWFALQENAAGLHRVFFLMDLPGECDPPGARPLAPVREGLRIEGVHFDYPDGTNALHGVDLEARCGQLTAIVGSAGAGKTTLAYLVPRFVDPSTGRVLIDGIDIAGVTLESLRSQISFVFQETLLFDDSVEENIRLGNPEASDDEVERAARAAGAHEFIRRLPQGYQTRLGRSGGKLSVGQKQRLSIARALVRDAPILIFDEPTSALDSLTEGRLVETLRSESRTKLVIVIAHRLSTIQAADQILFLERGEIIERGRHGELIRRPDGAYRRFAELQQRGAA